MISIPPVSFQSLRNNPAIVNILLKGSIPLSNDVESESAAQDIHAVPADKTDKQACLPETRLFFP